jgi:hypothetical protein
MKDCAEIYESGDTRVALILKDGAWYRLILKTTRNLKEAFFVSLHRLNADTLTEVRRARRIY